MGRREKRRTVVRMAVLRPSPFEPDTSPLRWLKTTKAERSSTTLSPPNARRARLPVSRPTPIEPATSTTIQRELRYSTEMARLIRTALQPVWLGGQQHPTQLEHESGASHASQDVSRQSQDPQNESMEDMGLEVVQLGRRDVVELLLPLAVVRAELGEPGLEGAPVVELVEVGDLVEDDVVAEALGEGDELPAE